MSHTSKEPPSQYAAGDLPSNPPEGTVAYDKTNQKMVAFKNSSWGDFGGSGGVGSTTYVRDNVAGVIDQIQGDISASWKSSDTSLKGLVIGTSCTSIGNEAFYLCSFLTGDLVIPDSVTSIGSYAFYDCVGLTGDLVIPDGVTTIGSGAFGGCTGFNGTLTIGNSVTSIGFYAFVNCGSLTGSLVIPDSVTTIEGYAFGFCTGLTALYTNTPAASWVGTNALSNTTALVNIYYGPNTNNGAGYSATFQGGSGMTVSAWTNYPNIP